MGIKKIELKDVKRPVKGRGIVILALKHNLYARYAHNLILSLRQPNNGLFKAGIEICLVADQGRLNEVGVKTTVMVDETITVSEDQSYNPFFTKLFIDQLSPYEETLLLDADMLAMPDANLPALFDSMKDVEFTCSNRGWITRQSGGYDWADVTSLLDAAGVDQMPHVSSEFVYFKKTKKVVELFDKARTFYLTNNVVNTFIGTHQPDEPALSYGITKAGIQLPEMPYHPSFWEGHYKGVAFKPQQIYRHTFLSVGGSMLSNQTTKIYDGLLKGYAIKGNTTYYPYTAKGKVIKERLLL